MGKTRISRDKFNAIRPFFDSLIESGELSHDYISYFWSDIIDRRSNFPTYNELATFRRGGQASYIGFSPGADEESEFVRFQLDFERARSIAPIEYLRRNQESDLGLPYQFERDGILSSASGLHNAAQAYQIEKALNEETPLSNHRILEIGAGYGGVAEILIRNLEPSTYVICDLPHNLYLSAIYLAVNFPDRSLYFVDDRAPEHVDDNSLVFVTPRGLELMGDRFSLVINTYSFQEMPTSEIYRYFAYIRDHLQENGLFYFLNTYGATGAQKPSDYPFEYFKVASWEPPAFPQPRFLHRKQHFQVIMQTKNAANGLPSWFNDTTHTLSLLMFMGITDNLSKFCERMLVDEIGEQEQADLGRLYRCLTHTSPGAAMEELSATSPGDEWVPIVNYVTGLLRLLENDLSGAAEAFSDALSTGLEGLAASRALIGLSVIARKNNDRPGVESYMEQAIQTCPQFRVGIEALDGRFNIEAFNSCYKFAFPNLGIREPKGRFHSRAIRRAKSTIAKTVRRIDFWRETNA